MPNRALIAILIPLVALLGLGHGLDQPAGAQSTYDAGISVALRVGSATYTPGTTLTLAVELTNTGAQPVTLELRCTPGFDVHLRNAGGEIVWRLHPDCVPPATALTLQPGQTQTWTGVWTGVSSRGHAVAGGHYALYGVVDVRPHEAVAGPVFLLVDAPTATPEPTRTHEPTTHPTATPEPTEPPVSGPRFEVIDGVGRQVRPDVAGHPEINDCQNLVVWWDETARQIWGRFVEREWRGEPFLISGEAAADGPPKVAYNIERRRWLVVWSGETDAGHQSIHGRYRECGEFEGPVFIIEAESTDDDQPAVAAHGRDFAVVWRRAHAGLGHRIVGAQVAGLDTGQFAALSDVGDVAEPAIACEGRARACLVAWTRGGGDTDVVGRYWFAREEIVGAAVLEIAVTDHGERYPSVAWNGWYDHAAYAVTWTDEGGDRTTVRARTVYPRDFDGLDNYVVDDAVFQVSTDAPADHGDVAALGPDFVAVWSAGHASNEDILARRLVYAPGTHDLAGGPADVISDHPGAERFPAVASALDPFALAVWQVELDGGDADILGMHIVATAAMPPTPRVELSGTLAGHETSVDDGTLSINVHQVFDGSFTCPQARLYYENPARFDTSLRVGDPVFVRADPLPDRGPCWLTLGAPGTGIERMRGGPIHLPLAHRLH